MSAAAEVIDHAISEPDPIDIHVGERIRAYRRALNISQSDLGSRIGVSFQQIQKYERGANRVSASMLCYIADALSCQPWELLPQRSRQVKDKAIDDAYKVLGRSGGIPFIRAAAKLPRWAFVMVTEMTITLCERSKGGDLGEPEVD